MHECKSNYISKVNEKLSELQSSRILKTPFKWLMKLPKKLKISKYLQEKLVESGMVGVGVCYIRSDNTIYTFICIFSVRISYNR